ncbi:hypothetical protein VM98_35320, partial [Streptomyces rubellomurinus subsp. indigoferus]
LGADEPQLAVRGGQALAPRLTAAPAGPAGRTALTDLDGTVLVTGGGEGTGGELARHPAPRHGVRGLLLLGGSGPADGQGEELAKQGALVRLEAPGMDRLLAVLEALTPPQGHLFAPGL